MIRNKVENKFINQRDQLVYHQHKGKGEQGSHGNVALCQAADEQGNKRVHAVIDRKLKEGNQRTVKQRLARGVVFGNVIYVVIGNLIGKARKGEIEQPKMRPRAHLAVKPHKEHRADCRGTRNEQIYEIGNDLNCEIALHKQADFIVQQEEKKVRAGKDRKREQAVFSGL